MNTEDLLSLSVPAMYLVMAVIEKIWPARRYPKVKRWQLVGIGFFLLLAAMGVALPLALPLDWLASHRLLDGSKLGVAGGVVVGYLAITFVAYWWHRFMHRTPLLWRFSHQMHHSARRLDIPSSVIFHPIDMAIFNLLPILVSVFVLGLDPMASAIIGVIGAFVSMWQHWNVRTPHFLGYFLQRPEQHNVHHQVGVHGYNYGDLSFWDLLFGTFANPREFDGEVGFDVPAPFGKMLLGVDVHATGRPGSVIEAAAE